MWGTVNWRIAPKGRHSVALRRPPLWANKHPSHCGKIPSLFAGTCSKHPACRLAGCDLDQESRILDGYPCEIASLISLVRRQMAIGIGRREFFAKLGGTSVAWPLQGTNWA